MTESRQPPPGYGAAARPDDAEQAWPPPTGYPDQAGAWQGAGHAPPGAGYQDDGYGQPGPGQQYPEAGYQDDGYGQPGPGQQYPEAGYQDDGYGQPGPGQQYPEAGYQDDGYGQPGPGQQYPEAGYQDDGYGQPGPGQQYPDAAAEQAWPQQPTGYPDQTGAWQGAGHAPPGAGYEGGYGQPGPGQRYPEAGYENDGTRPVPYGGYPGGSDGYGDDGWGAGPPTGRRGRGRRRLIIGVVLLLLVLVAWEGLRHLSRPGSPQAGPAASTGTMQPAARPASSRASSSPAPQGVTPAAARGVLAAYLTANNEANRSRRSSELAGIEGGSSYLLDAGSYRWTKVTDPSNSKYRPITFADPSFYVPRESEYPLWFAVHGQWTGLDGSQTGLDAAYLVFTRASASSPWLEILEPDILAGSPRIQIAMTASGYAEQVNLTTADGLSVAPSSIQSLTARYLGGSGSGLTGLSMPGNLQDLSDAQFWRSKLPQGSGLSLKHTPSGNQVFGLRTADGGALLFYDLGATMTMTAPQGSSLQIQIPGYYSSDQPVTSATLPYVDQFAVFDPPQAQMGSPVAVASAGGIASQS